MIERLFLFFWGGGGLVSLWVVDECEFAIECFSGRCDGLFLLQSVGMLRMVRDHYQLGCGVLGGNSMGGNKTCRKLGACLELLVRLQ